MFDMLTSPYTHPLKRLIWMRLKAGAKAVWDTISGNPVTFSAKAAPLRQLKVAFSPVQSGTGDPSPDNVRPISGWSSLTVEQTGKNLFDVSKVTGASVASLGEVDGTTLIAKRSGAYSGIWWVGSTIYLKAGETVTISADVLIPSQEGLTSKSLWLGLKPVTGSGEVGGYISVSAFDTTERASVTMTTIESGEFYLRAQGAGDIINEIVRFSNIQVELGSTAHDFVPYNGRSISISLGETVYSGYVDVISGVGEITGVAELQTVGAVKLRTIPYSTTYPNTAYYRINTSYAYKSDTVVLGNIGMLYSNAVQAAQSGGIGYALSTGTGTGQYLHTMIPMEEGDTAQTIDTRYFGYNPVVYYELLDPIPIQLTPQEVSSLLGENVMWTDAQNLEVTYRSN